MYEIQARTHHISPTPQDIPFSRTASFMYGIVTCPLGKKSDAEHHTALDYML